nr:hypothetical protein BaRGS_031871 [Batillaria attramentaria]
MTASPNVSLLDSLQEQLSRLSSDDATLNTSFDTGRGQGQVWGYRDHAEATLPHKAESGTVLSLSEADSKTRVCGTGSVFITLDKSGQETSTPVQSSPWREGPSSDEGETKDGGWKRSTPTTHHGGKVAWRRPASSSSELDESDGNYSSISTTESGQYPLTHTPLSESDFPPSEGPEDYDNVHSFHDFVSGLHGQSTSDQPSVRHAPDVYVSTDFRSGHLRSPFIQETILEADDESESADEADTTLNSFKTSLHFSVSQVQSTPTAPPPSHVPQIKLWSAEHHVTTLSPSDGDYTATQSPVNPLQDLSDRLASISTVHDTSDRMSTVSDTSYEVEQHLSHTLDSHHMSELDASLARLSYCSSPAPSDVSEGSVYSSVGFAEVKKTADTTSSTKVKSSESKSQHVRRNLASTFKSMKELDWVVEKQELFERLLADIEKQGRPQTHVMFDELCSFETQQREGGMDAQTDACDDLYRAFTREDLEKRQNHVCPIIDDQIMPVFRFKRFLKKNHCSKFKGKRRFKILNKMARLAESSIQPEGVTSPNEMEFCRSRQKPYERTLGLTSHSKLADSRLPSDVFTEEDVKRSFSDSAYSTLSSTSSRHWSDFDSMVSVSSSRGDVSSVTTDCSMDSDKITALSDVFDQLDVCEGQIDQALLDRLRVGHYSYVPTRRSHHN